jgi:chorismate dehydratase
MPTVPDPYPIAAVSYLNSRSLLFGLDTDPLLKLSLAVPSSLLGLVQSGQAKAALLPVIDIPKLASPTILPVGGIGCDGPTLTVRVFSRVPWRSIASLATDGDSHTSVALARILLLEAGASHPKIVPLSRSPDADATLLIGDKVITAPPPPGDYQYDLGEEWKRLTGLPFVFAVWTAEGPAPDWLAPRLSLARTEGHRHLSQIVRTEAAKYGWPEVLAMHYLGTLLRFEIGERQLTAIQTFHTLARKHGIS